MSTARSLTLALLLTGGLVFAPAHSAVQASEAANSRAFELPAAAGAGDGKEVTVLMDESHLKLATITLRGGTPLPTHGAPVPATILVLEGEGVVHIGGAPLRVSTGTLVSLAAGEDHDVVPADGSDMLLLVHYLRSAGGAAAPSSTNHDH